MVLLPDPFGPASAVIWPLGPAKLTPSTAFVRAPGYVTTRSSTAITTLSEVGRGKTERREERLSLRVAIRSAKRVSALQDQQRLPACRQSIRRRGSAVDVLARPSLEQCVARPVLRIRQGRLPQRWRRRESRPE